MSQLQDNLLLTAETAPSIGKLRVLHLVPSFAGGGAERQLGYLCMALANLGVHVHVGYVHAGPNLNQLCGTAVHLHQLDCAGNHDPRLPIKVGHLIREVQPNVVQTWLLQMDVLGGLAAIASGVPWVLSERSSSDAVRVGWKYRVRKWLAQRASAVVANSASGMAYWNNLPKSTRRCTIGNIVPLDAIAATPSTLEVDDQLFNSPELVVAAGRFETPKNWLTLIAALDLALQTKPNAQAVIFGEGTLRPALLQAKANSACSDRIHIRGYTNDLWKWLKRASLYVSVSHYEGNPNVLLEAIACGSPVVVSDIPSHREVLSPGEAYFVPTGPATSIARELAHALDKCRWLRLSSSSTHRAVAQGEPTRIAEQYVELYREIATDRP